MTKVAPELLRNPLHLLSLGFGAGLAPVAPGTFGTLVAIPLYLLLAHLALPWYLLILATGFVLGVYLCGYTSDALGVEDHPGIVWDEIIGFGVTMIAVPLNVWWILAGFVLFRIFDILKPWPVKLADSRLKGGFGIMFDDLLAGCYALACMHFGLNLLSELA